MLMANEHMKTYSTSLIIREMQMQVKPTMREDFTGTWLAII